jgi:hypothetical protein
VNFIRSNIALNSQTTSFIFGSVLRGLYSTSPEVFGPQLNFLRFVINVKPSTCDRKARVICSLQAAGIPSIGTKFALLADDDVVWPPKLLPHMLLLFEDYTIGAVGTCQRIRQRYGLGMMDRIWQYLGACYIERCNFEIAATLYIDGGISCLSGRTAAIRASILQKNDFVERYINER